MSLLPLCRDALVIKHHQAAPLLPPPQGFGWELNDANALEIRWTDGDLMSQELADVVVYSHEGDNEDDDVDLIFEA